VRLAVFCSDLGFNALALHRVVILDSLLLDGLKRYAEGAVVYGTVANGYTDKLAAFIGGLHTRGQLGDLGGALRFDKGNPYGIPPPPDLDENLERQAENLFEEMVAAVICHECSHIFLDHVEKRYLAAVDMQHKLLLEKLSPEAAQQMTLDYLNYSLGPTREFEADSRCSQLFHRLGYSTQGQRRVLYLCKRIEEITGQVNNPLRTHPSSVERWRRIEALDKSSEP
jgi:hypothetical protein